MDLRVARGEQSKEVLRQAFIKLFKNIHKILKLENNDIE